MSLILEALRKLERDKAAPDRGFVVMTANAWPAAGTGRRVSLLAAVFGGAALLGLGLWAATRPKGPVNSVADGGPSLTADGAASTPPTIAPRVDAPAAAATPASSDDVPSARGSLVPSPEPLAPLDVAAPATPAAPSTPRPRELRLQAISQRDGKPIALLNDRLVREGETFDGVLIVAIRVDEVEVEVNGRRTVLKF